MQEEEYITGSLARPGIHLNGTALLTANHPGMWCDDLDRPVNAPAVGDDQLELTLLRGDAVEAGKNTCGFVQRRNDDGNSHGSTKNGAKLRRRILPAILRT